MQHDKACTHPEPSDTHTFSVSCGQCAAIQTRVCALAFDCEREKSDISDNTASLFSGSLCSSDRIPIRTPRLGNTYLHREQERDQHTTQHRRACFCKQPLVMCCPSYWACSVQGSVFMKEENQSHRAAYSSESQRICSVKQAQINLTLVTMDTYPSTAG